MFNGAAGDDEVAAAKARVGRWLRPQAGVLGMQRSVVIAGGAGERGSYTGLRAFVVCGIARPEMFVADVRALGLEVVGQRAFGDHHTYTAADVSAVEHGAARANAEAIVVTEKDWVKLRRFGWGMPVHVARLDVRVFGPGSDFGIR